MNTTTLRGVFPDPKPVYKRNFIKENVKHIKQMQGLLQNSGLFETRPSRTKTISSHNAPTRSHQTLAQSRSLPVPKLQRVGRNKAVEERCKLELGASKLRLAIPDELPEKHTHRGVQTDAPEDINKMYENGIIKYPSPGVLKGIALKNSPRRRDLGMQHNRNSQQQGSGDMGGIIVPNPHNKELNDDMQNLDINEKHNFIKENILALRQKATKQDASSDPIKMPNYQKGVLPKYLRDRKEEEKREGQGDAECPDGHVLLPEEERKETLRVLRQSYADRIQELNCMPVRNDTLRMHKRKMAIEEELKKIDEDINEKHNFIKENILALRQKATKQDASSDPIKMPNYQKGVLPKYLRDRKEEEKREGQGDAECPDGHVLLPEEERKETLRVLRQSYADRIQELNCMPVRNDTLRMHKRKMAIEEELKKIDEGIKVFQRPKVFVKINA